MEEALRDNIGKPKELWKHLKSLGLKSNGHSSSKICLEQNDQISFDAKANSGIFKEFYSNLASDLVKKLPTPKNKYGQESVKAYYKKFNIQRNFKFSLVTHDHILNHLCKINPTKAAGIDSLGGRFLKDGAQLLTHPIMQLCNLSITLSAFPDKCKLAKLKPLFKKGSKTEPKNYRPISLLPLVSKIIEKVIHDQTQAF